MSSFRQLTNEGVIHRADGEKIGYFDIHIEPGFNPGGRTEEEEEDDEELYRFIEKKGIFALEQWEVRPREEGGVWIVDGHRRHKQFGRIIAAGKAILDKKTQKYLVPIKQFGGNDLERLYRIGTSNKKKDMKPLQFAELCKRAFHGFKQTPEQIAEGMVCSRAKVAQALLLAGANHDVQEAVKSGAVAATEAVKVVRKHGEKAGEVIQKAVEVAAAAGKTKATAKHIEPDVPGWPKKDRVEVLRRQVSCEDFVAAIRKEMAGGTRCEVACPDYAELVVFLRGTEKVLADQASE